MSASNRSGSSNSIRPTTRLSGSPSRRMALARSLRGWNMTLLPDLADRLAAVFTVDVLGPLRPDVRAAARRNETNHGREGLRLVWAGRWRSV
jgi:hypothetical protein